MNIFKRKYDSKSTNEEPYEYWKDPRLDDEGTYDYLVEELPIDTIRWEWYYKKCDSCGKHHYLNLYANHHFYCWDGWDSMDYTECWWCIFTGKIHSFIWKIKKKTKALFEAIKYCIKARSFKSFKLMYKNYFKLRKEGK